jgi:aminoglycoside/choline kinase family phosphotransferase
MIDNTIQHDLKHLYRQTFGQLPQQILPLGADGSSRQYFRLHCEDHTVIGAYNTDRRENVAFMTLSRHFKQHHLPVPEIYAADLDLGVYLQQDLGDDTLYDRLMAIRKEDGSFSKRLIHIYEMVLEALPRFQIAAGKDLDYSVCYPRSRFDEQSIRWDLNYFKYHFLKLANIPFDEQALEDDFERLTAFLLETETTYFLYRDFQSRNIMWYKDQPYFIDYQGGRQGALQYDVASLLQDAKADIPWDIRDTLLDHYIDIVDTSKPVDRKQFIDYYYGYALIRLMQAFGAYGFRGLYENKSHFLRSIPFAVQNLEGLMARARLPVALPALQSAWERICTSDSVRRMGIESPTGLTIHLWSFSYKRGVPRDESGHGGGFVFDCRALPNPGRYPAYARLTGRDTSVAAFLEEIDEVQAFREQVTTLVDQAVAHHLRRGFTDLTIAFGCTGGQHRSVYFADLVAAHLRDIENITVDLRHREQNF